MIEFHHHESLNSVPWAVALGVVSAYGVNLGALEAVLASAQEAVSFGAPEAMKRIQAFESFFDQNGFRSPLGYQLKRIQEKGLPGGSPVVRALLLCEMSTGLLMGAQDASAIKGTLVCDLAQEGESFSGMREEVLCRKDEIVLKDEEGVIATLFQGPDHRTRLKKDTKDIVFFIFSAPGVSAAEVREGVWKVHSVLQRACSEIQVQVYESRTPLVEVD
ncbi:MAG TPA: phenylalanine--tRNA ligase beta subunit-related protein [Candidatus Angelobacter sp.]|jgi:DNA/RNA-binding domain of Phe-tRNA-synthetase-like protein